MKMITEACRGAIRSKGYYCECANLRQSFGEKVFSEYFVATKNNPTLAEPRPVPAKGEHRSSEMETSSQTLSGFLSEPSFGSGREAGGHSPSRGQRSSRKGNRAIPGLAAIKTCKADFPLNHFVLGTPFGFVICLGFGVVLLLIAFALGLGDFAKEKSDSLPFVIICGLAVGLIGWVFGFIHYASEGNKVSCPACGRWFAALTYHRESAKVGEGRTTIPDSYRITNSDGSFGGYLDGWQQVSTDIVAEHRELICKFCGHVWARDTTRQIVS